MSGLTFSFFCTYFLCTVRLDFCQVFSGIRFSFLAWMISSLYQGASGYRCDKLCDQGGMFVKQVWWLIVVYCNSTINTLKRFKTSKRRCLYICFKCHDIYWGFFVIANFFSHYFSFWAMKRAVYSRVITNLGVPNCYNYPQLADQKSMWGWGQRCDLYHVYML